MTKKRFRLFSLFTLIGIAAAALSAVIVPRRLEQRISTHFSESGSLNASWLIHQQATKLDRLLGFDGFAEEVVLNGHDGKISTQVDLLNQLVHLKSLQAFSVDLKWTPFFGPRA